MIGNIYSYGLSLVGHSIVTRVLRLHIMLSIEHIQTIREYFQPNKKARALEKFVSWLKKGQNVPFLREICPFKKRTPESGAVNGIITGILLKIVIFLSRVFY
jgi:hypothetical protein